MTGPTLTDAQLERLDLIELLHDTFDRATPQQLMAAAQWVLDAPTAITFAAPTLTGDRDQGAGCETAEAVEPYIPEGGDRVLGRTWAGHELVEGTVVNLRLDGDVAVETDEGDLRVVQSQGIEPVEAVEPVEPYVPEVGDRILGLTWQGFEAIEGIVTELWSDGDVTVETDEGDLRVVDSGTIGLVEAVNPEEVQRGERPLYASELEALPVRSVLADEDGDLYVLTDTGYFARLHRDKEGTYPPSWGANEVAVFDPYLINAEYLDGPVWVMDQRAFDSLPKGTILREYGGKGQLSIRWRVLADGWVELLATYDDDGTERPADGAPTRPSFPWAHGMPWSQVEVENVEILTDERLAVAL